MKFWLTRVVIYGGLLFVVVHFTRFFWDSSLGNEAMPLPAMDIPAIPSPDTTTPAPDVQSTPSDTTNPFMDKNAEAKAAKVMAKEAVAEAMKQNTPAGEDFGKLIQGALPLRETVGYAVELPAIDRRLTAAQVEAYVAIVKDLVEAVKSENNKLKQKYENMWAQKKGGSAAFSLAELEAMDEQYVESMVDAAHAAAIMLRDKHGLSFNECAFINARVKEAIPFMTLEPPSANATKAQLQAALKRENAVVIDVMYRQKTKGIASVEQTRANAKLFKPYTGILIASISEPLLFGALLKPAQ